MRESILFYKDGSRPSLRELIFPSRHRVISELIIGTILLAFLNSRAIWSYLNSNHWLQSQQLDFGDILNAKIQHIYYYFSGLAGGRFLQIVFWLIVGCLIYLLIWFMINIITDIRNDIVADSYVHPRFYNRAAYWQSIIFDRILLVSIVVVFLVYIFLFLKFLPKLAKLCYEALQSFSLPHSPLVIVACIIGLAVLLQALGLLSRLLINAWKYIYG